LLKATPIGKVKVLFLMGVDCEHSTLEVDPELIDLIMREFRGVDVDACP